MRPILLLLMGFVAITAIIGGGMMMATPDGSSLNLSLSLLHNTGFNDFFIPGFILLCFVGGSSLVAVFTLMHNHPKAPSLAIFAGAVMLVWMIVQLLFTGFISWMQLVYILAGLLILLIAVQLKGKAII